MTGILMSAAGRKGWFTNYFNEAAALVILSRPF